MNTDLGKTQKYLHWLKQKIYYNTGKTNQRKWTVKRGEVYFVDLGENIGSEENKIRPCVVLQADSYNFRSPVFTSAIISSSPITIPDIQISITGTYPYIDEKGICKHLEGAVDLGQIKTIGKERIIAKVCTLKNEMHEVDTKLLNAFGLTQMLISKNNEINYLKGKIEYLRKINN